MARGGETRFSFERKIKAFTRAAQYFADLSQHQQYYINLELMSRTSVITQFLILH